MSSRQAAVKLAAPGPTAVVRRRIRARDLVLVGPFAYALLLPVLPMLILLADVLPRGIAIGTHEYAVALGLVVPLAGVLTIIGLASARGIGAFVRPPLVWPLAALIVSELIAGLTGALLRASAFEILSTIGDAVAFLAIYWTMTDRALRRRFIACLLTSGAFACAFAIGLTLTRHPPAAFAYQHGRAAGTFLQPNEFAGYLLFLIPLALAQSLVGPTWLRRLAQATAVFGVTSLILSVSRAGWLGIIAGLPILVLRLGRKALFAYALALALLAVFGATNLRNVAHDPSENASRITVWRGAMRMAERFALTGVGPVAFSKVYPSFREPNALVDEVHAHDLPLNVLVENGILGFAAFVWAVIASVNAIRSTGDRIKERIKDVDRERMLLYFALAAGFIGSAVQNLVDVVTTFSLMLWWPMLGLLLTLGPERAHEHA